MINQKIIYTKKNQNVFMVYINVKRMYQLAINV